MITPDDYTCLMIRSANAIPEGQGLPQKGSMSLRPLLQYQKVTELRLAGPMSRRGTPCTSTVCWCRENPGRSARPSPAGTMGPLESTGRDQDSSSNSPCAGYESKLHDNVIMHERHVPMRPAAPLTLERSPGRHHRLMLLLSDDTPSSSQLSLTHRTLSLRSRLQLLRSGDKNTAHAEGVSMDLVSTASE